MLAMLSAILLAAPGNCPPELGQIRWDGFIHDFRAGGKAMSVRGTLWDTNRNGRPSSGDLLRVDSAMAGGEDLPLDEPLWVKLGGGLGKQFARTYKKTQARLSSTCESDFGVKGVPKLGSAGALGRVVLAAGRPAKVDPVAEVEAEMRGWAEAWCAKKQHIEEEQLKEMLLKQAGRRRGIKKGTLTRTAKAVAKDYAISCAHITMPKLTFD